MKRASSKKVNAIPACPVRQDASEGNLSPVPLEVDRRVRTSAAMIGLAISMGASSILLTRQSDRALATEPVNPTMTTGTVAQEDAAQAVAPNNQVVPEVISSGSTVTSSSAVVPITQGMPTSAAVVKPMMPGMNQPVQVGPTLWQLSQNYQVDAVAITAYNNLAEQPDSQAEQAPQVSAANTAIQKATAGKTVEFLSDPRLVLPKQTAQPMAATAVGETNALLRAKQAAALNQLRHKSNRLQNSLAEWRSEESSYNGTAVTQGAVSTSKLEEAQTPTADKVAAATIDEQATKESALKVDVPKAASNLPQQSEELPSAVAEPTAVVSVTAPGYQVRKGDTLSTIAHNYGITLAELVSVNHLTNPNRLQINQRLTIPASEPSLLADSETVAGSKRWHSPQTALSVTPSGLKQADKNSVATVLAAPLTETPSVHLGVAKIPASAQTYQSERLAARPELQSNPYVENLRLEVLRLREKYQARQADRQAVPVATGAGAVAIPISVPAPNTAVLPSRPTTLEFLPEQLPLTSESTTR